MLSTLQNNLIEIQFEDGSTLIIGVTVVWCVEIDKYGRLRGSVGMCHTKQLFVTV